MLSTPTRILPLRPLRPPSTLRPRRLFTQNSALLLIAPRTSYPRPQLPYLSQPAFRRHQPPVARLLSTETKTYVKEQFYLATKWTLIGWTFLLLGGVAYFGWVMEMDERENPTPDEWSFYTRHHVRAARNYIYEEAKVRGYVDWAKVGSRYLEALRRCEDPGKDGKGLQERAGDGEEIVIPGVGRAGYDVSGKSWPWRAGYFEVVMGCATAAEHLDQMVLDTSRGLVMKKEFVVGPSNPDARPAPSYMGVAPKEEDCVRPFEAPEVFYMRILTGKGFTTKQKMTAARAYANWLDFKGLNESAEEMHRWALDIAKGALPLGVEAEKVIDGRTAVVRESPDVTPNVLRASTDLAIHHASNGNVAAALPIFLSVLRARRVAPVSPFPPPLPAQSDLGNGIRGTLSKLWNPPRSPPPPPSGDNPLIRHSDKPTCEESELMLYIGEILFATSPSSTEGMGWTRQAVTIADANLTQLTPTPEVDEKDERRKCKECLKTGVSNWEVMLARLAAEKPVVKKGWFGGKTETKQDFEDEMARVAALKERFAKEMMEQA